MAKQRRKRKGKPQPVKAAQQRAPQEEPVGVQAYRFFGSAFLLCGVVSLVLMGFVALLPQDHEKYNLPLFFGVWLAISLGLAALGVGLLALCKRSERFRQWAQKDVMDFIETPLRKERKRQEEEGHSR